MLFVSAILCCVSAFQAYAETRIVDVRPARTGRDISVEQSQTAGLRPVLKRYGWTPKGTLTENPRPFKAAKPTLPVSDTPGIVWGESVSRNEFGGDRGYFFSPDSSLVLVYRKDERAVTEFPLLDITTRTGSLIQIRYPMNGMASEKLALFVCDRNGKPIVQLDVTDFTDERYLTNPAWSPDGKYVIVQVLDRSQHEMHLNQYDARSGEFVCTLLTEYDNRWVEPQNPVEFVRNDAFIYRTDSRDGFRNLYLCDFWGGVRRMTKVNADVSFVAFKGGYLYYTSAEVSPVENHLFRMKVATSRNIEHWKFGKPERLTAERGWHSVQLNPDGTEFIDSWTSFNNPGRCCLRSTKGGTIIRDLDTAQDKLETVAQPEIEFGTVTSADGRFDNWFRFFKPCNFDPSKKYPLIVYVYGGPHSQMVQDKWLANIRMWELVMAQKGYAVYVQDNRGTQNRGSEFEKAINRQCGQAEAADQFAGLEELLKRNPWIDRSRIGVHGWSYGGFMTLTMACERPGTFKAAVAGGPVIDWKWYEVMYGERYMDTEADNPDGFLRTGLVGKVAGLKEARDAGIPVSVLICQGAIDDTVVWEHSLSFVQECILQGVRLDYFPYPCDRHNMAGKARVHLYEKITDYFERNL